MVYRAVIVGCGLIGSAFSDTATIPGVWSHAGAYAACPNTNLVAVCDTDPTKLAHCADRWNIKARYSDFQTMLDQTKPDIVSICTPDESHYQLIRAALGHSTVRAILAEKPLALSLKQAAELVEIAAARGIVFAVNYTRRYATGFVQARKKLRSGLLGKVQTVSGFFTKGTLHNGSHWFDLAEFLVGAVQTVRATDRLKESGSDPTLDVVIGFEGGATGYLHGCDYRSFAIFEMTIVCTKGRLCIIDSGFSIDIWQVETSPIGAGYRRLAFGERIEGDLSQALLHAVEDTVKCLDEGRAPICSGKDAMQALRISIAAQSSVLAGAMVTTSGQQ